MNTAEILEWIWGLSSGKHVFLPKQPRKDGVAQWEEGRAFLKTGALMTFVFEELTDIREVDMYFSVMSFVEPRRNIENVAPWQQVAWLDLDSLPEYGGPLHALREQQVPEPNILWSTSPGHFQAVWRLAAPMSHLDYQSFGKAFTDRVGGR